MRYSGINPSILLVFSFAVINIPLIVSIMASREYHSEGARAHQREFAKFLDSQDPLNRFRKEFIIPSKKDLKRKVLAVDESAYH